ncbi:hypothetical protein TraAM80_10216, partial [Trypanosoma rangeli]
MQETDKSATVAYNAVDVSIGEAEETSLTRGSPAASALTRGKATNSPRGTPRKGGSGDKRGAKDCAGMEGERLHDVSVATQETNTCGSPKRIGGPAKPHQRRGISPAVPYP